MKHLKSLNEWKLNYSDNFIDILNKIDHPIASDLLELYGDDNKDIDVNFIDLASDVNKIRYKSDDKISRKITEKDPKNIDDEELRQKFSKRVPYIVGKIGKTVQKILKLNNKTYSSSDIERFVSKFIAVQSLSDANFEVTKGEGITKGYNSRNYIDGDGDLQNSCMQDMDDEVFDLYTRNKNCSMLILWNDDEEILGRCILWKAELNGEKIKFMDRIYTDTNHELEIFRMWAKEKGYYYRIDNDNSEDFNRWHLMSPNGEERNMRGLTVKLNEWEFEQYPYVDSMCHLNMSHGVLCNSSSRIRKMFDGEGYRRLQSTGGGYDNID